MPGCPLSPRLALSVALLALPAGAHAQAAHSVTVDASGGTLFFADDDIVREAIVGGAARLHVTPRLSIGPELLYVSGATHSHLILGR